MRSKHPRLQAPVRAPRFAMNTFFLDSPIGMSISKRRPSSWCLKEFCFFFQEKNRSYHVESFSDRPVEPSPSNACAFIQKGCSSATRKLCGIPGIGFQVIVPVSLIYFHWPKCWMFSFKQNVPNHQTSLLQVVSRDRSYNFLTSRQASKRLRMRFTMHSGLWSSPTSWDLGTAKQNKTKGWHVHESFSVMDCPGGMFSMWEFALLTFSLPNWFLFGIRNSFSTKNFRIPSSHQAVSESTWVSEQKV